jgi:hypothetical protein
MVVTTKHALEHAARFAGLHTSQFSKLLTYHGNVAVSTLESLSKQQAQQLAKALHPLQGLPWKIALIVDSTLQRRASLHPENAKRFKHGNGCVIGHPWTNSVLILNDMVIPLRPIPFYSQPYCREHACDSHTEHALVVDYLGQWNLEDSIGSHDPRAVIVLADSGYENKKIAQAMVNKRWQFLIALGKTRRVKSEALSLTTPKARQWCPIVPFFRHHRRVKWPTMRVTTNGAQHKRMVLRIRDTMGYLRYVGQVPLVCSELRNRPEGRRKYLACSDMRGTARQIIIGYRLRWAMELLHKNVKQHLGFEEVATSGFDSVMSHVYWGYCAYILMRHPTKKLRQGLGREG